MYYVYKVGNLPSFLLFNAYIAMSSLSAGKMAKSKCLILRRKLSVSKLWGGVPTSLSRLPKQEKEQGTPLPMSSYWYCQQLTVKREKEESNSPEAEQGHIPDKYVINMTDNTFLDNLITTIFAKKSTKKISLIELPGCCLLGSSFIMGLPQEHWHNYWPQTTRNEFTFRIIEINTFKLSEIIVTLHFLNLN